MKQVPSVEESMAKIGAPAWTSYGYSCRREREILAELVQEQVSGSTEKPEHVELHTCGTMLLDTARDQFIKEVLAEEIFRYEKEMERWGQNSSLSLFVEFLNM